MRSSAAGHQLGRVGNHRRRRDGRGTGVRGVEIIPSQQVGIRLSELSPERESSRPWMDHLTNVRRLYNADDEPIKSDYGTWESALDMATGLDRRRFRGAR